MHTFWKLAAIALVVLGVTAVTSTLTTAYLTRIAVSEPAALAVSVAPAVRRAATVEVARPRPLPARALSAPRQAAAPAALAAAAPVATLPEDAVVHDSVPVSPDPVVASAPASTAAPRAENPAPEPAASTAAAPATARAPVPAAPECDAGGRTWKIAQPGLIGTAIGAGLGAAGGAIAKGGKGAGQGAIIGGLAGAALGSGYGAYRTKNECGSVFGNDQKVSEPGKKAPAADRGTPVIAEHHPPSAGGTEAPFAAEAPERITIYNAR